MPIIDVYATSGTFADPKALARALAATLMKHRTGSGHPDVQSEHCGIRPRPPGWGALACRGRQQLRQGASAHQRGGARS